MYVIFSFPFSSNPDVPTHESKVILECNETSEDKFNLINEDKMVRIIYLLAAFPNFFKMTF